MAFKMPLWIFNFLICSTLALPPLQIDPVGYTLSPWPEHPEDEQRVSSTLALPTTLHPTHYRLFLRPILDEGGSQFQAPGQIDITLDCLESTRSIVLNSFNIDINLIQTKVTDAGSGLEVPIASQEYDTQSQTFAVGLMRDLQVGVTYKLHLEFISQVANAVNGLYRSSYVVPETGERRWLATTQFQRSDARKAFPCFDEPGIKSVFEISLGHHDRHNTLCNMDIASQEPINGIANWTWDHYNPTPLMPSYLIAMIVSDFDHIQASDGLYRQPVQGWAAPHHIAGGGAEFAVREAARLMTYFEDIFDLEQPLPKVDNAAIPDFAFGAMENWGLVTYREPDMLYFNGRTTEAIRKRILLVVSHELAHFWFGDIVTCKTWKDIWLNEGFATYVSAVGVLYSQPEFQGMDFLITDSIQTSMDYDSQANSVPVSNDGPNPSRIIYDKGASLLRMINAFMTEPTFYKALQKYLDAKSFGNAVQDELFDFLNFEAVADGRIPQNITMKQILDTWTLQPHFPLVRVSRATNSRILVSQERFTKEPSGDSNMADENDLWWVPISIASETEPDFSPSGWLPKLWLPNNVHSTSFDINTDQWLVVNPDIQHYYRVLYDKHFFSLIKEQLERNAKVFSLGTRSQLLDDFFTFAYNNYERIERALDLTTYLDQEDELFPWIPVLKHLLKTSNLFSGSSHFDNFRDYLLPKIDAALESIGVEQTPSANGTKVILRVQLMDWACSFGSQHCQNYTRNLFGQWSTNPQTNPVPFDLQPVMYCALVGYNSQEGLDFALGKYKEAVDEINSVQAGFWRNALGCIKVDEISGLLDALMADPSGIPQEDVNTIFQQLTKNSETREAVFTYIQTNLESVITRHTTSVIRSISTQLAEHYNNGNDLARFEAFLNGNMEFLEEIESHLRQNIIVMQTNIQWMTNFGNDISAWMDSAMENSTF